jgi:hypothetical protein
VTPQDLSIAPYQVSALLALIPKHSFVFRPATALFRLLQNSLGAAPEGEGNARLNFPELV